MSYKRTPFKDEDSSHPQREDPGFAAAEIPGTLFFSAPTSGIGPVHLSGNCRETLGIEFDRIDSFSDLLLRHVHKDDSFRVLYSLEAALRGDSPHICTYRWLFPNQHIRNLLVRARVVDTEPVQVLTGLITELPLGRYSNEACTSHVISPHFLSLVGDCAFATDIDLRLLGITPLNLGLEGLFGEESFKQEKFVLGGSILNAFDSNGARERCSHICDQVVADPELQKTVEWYRNDHHFRADIRSIEVSGSVFLIFAINDCTATDETTRQMAEVRRDARELRFVQSGCETINGSLQTILSYAGILGNKELSPGLSRSISQELTSITQSTYGIVRSYLDINHSHSYRIPYSIEEILISIARSFMSEMPDSPLVLVNHSETTNTPSVRNLIEMSLPEILHGLARLKPEQIHIGIRSVGDENYLSAACYGDNMQVVPQSNWYEAIFGHKFVSTDSSIPKIYSMSENHCELRLLLPRGQFDASPKDASISTSSSSEEVLLVGGDRASRKSLGIIVSDCGFRSVSADGGEEAVELIRSSKRDFGLAIVDTLLHDIPAPRLLQQFRKSNPTLYCLGVVSSPEENRSLRRAGALATMQKPFEPPALRLVLSHIRKLKLLAA